MLPFIARRTALMVPVLLAISILSFIIIELPPGDYFSYYIDRLYAQGEVVDEGLIEGLRVQYGVDQPVLVQYLKWLSKIVRGDLGRSLNGQLVIVIVRERLPWSVLITVVSFVFVHVVGIPIGVLSATKQYSIRDYIATFIGFIGLAVPNFLLALVLVWVWFAWTGQVQIGLFSREYAMAPWSLARLWDLLKHLIIPAVVIGTAGTAGTIRSIRANLLDELQKTYVTVARSKGLSEARVLYKLPVPDRDQPVGQHHRLAAPQPGERRGAGVAGDRPSDPGTGPAGGVAGAGSVSGVQHHHDSEHADRDRHPGVRHRPGVGRPAHSAVGMSP